MSIDTVFKPIGSTYVIATTAVQLSVVGDPGGATTYRVRNTASTAQYFSWGPTNAVTCTAPVAGTPQARTIGMLPTSVETFELPAGSWVIGNTGSAFEFTPGQGA